MSFSSGCLCPPEDIVLWKINPVPLLWHGLVPSYIRKLSNFIPVPFSWHPLCNLIRASVTLHMYCFATRLLANEVRMIAHCHLYFALFWEIGQSSNFFKEGQVFFLVPDCGPTFFIAPVNRAWVGDVCVKQSCSYSDVPRLDVLHDGPVIAGHTGCEVIFVFYGQTLLRTVNADIK